MFRSGRRLFSAASLGLIVVAVLHTVGSFAPPPPDPALERLSAELRAYRFPLGLGMAPSLHDIQQSLALTMGVTLLWLGVGNLVAAARDDAAGRVVRGLNVVSVLGLALTARRRP